MLVLQMVCLILKISLLLCAVTGVVENLSQPENFSHLEILARLRQIFHVLVESLSHRKIRRT